MEYRSTRNASIQVSAAQAILQGISRESGLFVPDSLPVLDPERLQTLAGLDYIGRAEAILADFLPDFAPDDLLTCVQGAYGGDRFAHPDVAPVRKLNGDTYMLELWHGPTCAFKDMALQLLPRLLTTSARIVGEEREVVILVATSGDTGKAALEGFRDVDGTRILVFYPQDGVSDIQKLQMATQEGANVGVCGVFGNFDDTQTGVKRIFTDPAIGERMEAAGKRFSSANSINWGRLAPQIVYYVSAYCDLVVQGEIAMGETVNVAVPTGNFGNILAAYYAKEMGLPLDRLLCASNINNVLSDFIQTGVYDRRRDFHMTASPSMDILISSNLERLLFALYQEDRAVADLMEQLNRDGIYTVSDPVRDKLQTNFFGGFCDEEETRREIRRTWERDGYLLDPHTAVGLSVRNQYREKTGVGRKTIVASTANPYKFSGSMLEALGMDRSGLDGFAQLDRLAEATGVPVPPQIAGLRSKPVRFREKVAREEMADWVLRTAIG